MLQSHTEKLLVSLLVGALLGLPGGTSTAQTASTSASSTGVTSSTTETVTVEPAPVITDNMRAKLQPVAQTRITNLAANLSNRLDATTHRLENVSARLDSRLTKMKDSGLDTTAAALSLAKANDELAAAKKTLGTIDIEVTSFVGSENPVAAWARLETIYRNIIKNVLAAHSDLQTALTTLETTTEILTTPTSTSTITQ